jgi:hypothetical protein
LPNNRENYIHRYIFWIDFELWECKLIMSYFFK